MAGVPRRKPVRVFGDHLPRRDADVDDLRSKFAYTGGMFTITMSTRGQFVLPKDIRERLKLLPAIGQAVGRGRV